MDAEDLFPTQGQATPPTFSDIDLQSGAPFAPVPRSFLICPPALDICQPLASQQEISEISALRAEFNIGAYQAPYVADIARAFRLLKGKRAYLEVGTFDRGNLAFVSTLLADDAVIIGLDVVEEPSRDEKLRSVLKPGQTYHAVVGNSRLPATVERVTAILAGRALDAAFIDGDHTGYGVLADYGCYEGLIAGGGVILFHDSVWEGAKGYKGSAHALAEIDKLDPVYLIDGENPVRRFARAMWRQEFWGVVGVVLAAQQAWRKR